MRATHDDDAIISEQVVDDLWPYRCATLAEPRPAKGPSASSENLYTRKEVAWHTYRETGMYTIIRDNVYDMTGKSSDSLNSGRAPTIKTCINEYLEFVEFHPGGATLIKQWAGKDSTSAFNRHHRHAERCLQDYDFLRIGRVIDEGRLPIPDNKIVIHGMVYDLTRKYFVGGSPSLVGFAPLAGLHEGINRR